MEENTPLTEEVQMMDDVFYSSLVVNEDSRGKRPGVLSTVEGPFMAIDDENRNSRVYSRPLIENRIINLPYTKEMMKYNTLLGEGRHPKDRYEIWATEASHNITDLWISEDGKFLMGKADILDTPMGRIIQTLVDYGSTMGISARATGKVVKKSGKFYVDENTYNFKTFDFVTNPGFVTSRLTPVNESCEDYLENIYTSIRELVEKEDTDSGTLRAVKSILESAEDDKSKEILDLIESKSITEPETDKVSELEEVIDQINEEKESMTNENYRLRVQLKEANNKILAYQSRESRLLTEATQTKDSMEQLVQKKSRIISDLREESEYLSSQVKVLTEQIEALSQEKEVLEGLVVALDDDNKALNEDIESLRTSKSVEDNKPLSESNNGEQVTPEMKPERMRVPILESVVDAPVTATVEGKKKSPESTRLSRILSK